MPDTPNRMRAQAWPHWVDNPYLPELLTALREQGIDAFGAQFLAYGATRLRAGDWLHLHWPGETHRHRRRWRYRLSANTIRAELNALKRRGVRIAWTAHNLVPHDDPHPDLGEQARRDMLGVADHVFVHFPSARSELARSLGYAGPTTVVPHPHYLDAYPPPPTQTSAREALGLPEKGFVALAFGRIRPYKRIEAAVQAFRDVAGDDDRLVVAGVTEDDVSGDLAAAADDSRVVVYAKRIPDADVPTFFGAADVTVIAHRRFFTSGSAMLSLSMGCPILGPPIHHLADLAGENRLVPMPDGPDGIAIGLSRAREVAPTVDRAAVRAWAAQQGSWRDAAATIAEVMRR